MTLLKADDVQRLLGITRDELAVVLRNVQANLTDPSKAVRLTDPVSRPGEQEGESMVGIIWNNGTSITAESWEDLEVKVRLTEWSNYEPEAFRAEMALYAMNLTGTDIQEGGSSEDFFWELERASLLQTMQGIDLSTKPRNIRIVPIALYKRGGSEDLPYFGE